jgi:Flp pilus assembly protein CpaB
VAGLVQPGDKISVIVSLGVDEATKSGGEEKSTRISGYLLKGLKVLGIGSTTAVTPQQSATPASAGSTQTTQPAAQQTQNRGLITLEVTPRQALQIAQSYAFNAIFYVTLVDSHFDAKTFKAPAQITGADNLFDTP